MKSHLAAAAALAAGLMFASAGTARAGDTACMWNVLTPAEKQALAVSYAEKGPSGVEGIGDSSLLDRMDAACHPALNSVEGARNMGGALAERAIQNGAAYVLKTRFNIETPALEAAWAATDPALRERFRKSMVDYQVKREGPVDLAAADALMARLHLEGGDARRQVIYWTRSTVLIPYLESLF